MVTFEPFEQSVAAQSADGDDVGDGKVSVAVGEVVVRSGIHMRRL